MSSTVSASFEHPYSQIISVVVHGIGLTVISFCLGRRTVHGNLASLKSWRSLSLARIAVIGIFVDSWLFLASTDILVNGVGLSSSPASCSAAIFLCIGFYVTSKLFIYLFLSERVYVVWTSGTMIKRRESTVYRICCAMIIAYVIVITAMITARIAEFRSAGYICYIGLKQFGSIPLLTYDLLVNVIMTSLFIIPLLRRKIMNKKLKIITSRTLVAAAVALTVSAVNILILALLHGSEAGWICLASCSADVAANAIVIFWVTAGISSDELPRLTQMTMPVTFSAGPEQLNDLPVPSDFYAQDRVACECGSCAEKFSQDMTFAPCTSFPRRGAKRMDSLSQGLMTTLHTRSEDSPLDLTTPSPPNTYQFRRAQPDLTSSILPRHYMPPKPDLDWNHSPLNSSRTLSTDDPEGSPKLPSTDSES